jgi:hypothetical protein
MRIRASAPLAHFQNSDKKLGFEYLNSLLHISNDASLGRGHAFIGRIGTFVQARKAFSHPGFVSQRIYVIQVDDRSQIRCLRIPPPRLLWTDGFLDGLRVPFNDSE